MKAFITKYALSAGVLEVDSKDAGDGMIEYNGGGYTCYAHGDDWHATPYAAKIKAEAMRVARIASLKKQIAKLEKLAFALLLCALLTACASDHAVGIVTSRRKTIIYLP